MDPEIAKSLKHNLIVNLLDGGFFGFGLGFASFITVIPLFVSSLTDSAILIGLIPAIHSMGWQFPQLLTANRVAHQKRYKPMVLFMTIHERLPFLGLALVAWLLPVLGPQVTLVLTFVFLVWQGMGGGVTANAWQSMIGKIIPSDRRGTFYGAQSAAANVLAGLAAVVSGFILERLALPFNYTLCFLLACAALVISYYFLAQTREPENVEVYPPLDRADFWNSLGQILRRDGNFRWFLVARMLCQVAVMAFAFYTVFAVRQHGLSKVEVGLMTGVSLGSQIIVNPMMGWIGDHWSHRTAMQIGALAAVLSALLAWLAPAPSWFYLVFVLAGIANAAVWTFGLAMILEFGSEAERPAYIGLGNTLVAPVTILAPFLGGWLAERSGYPAAFLASAFGGLVTIIVLQWFVRDPRRLPAGQTEPIIGD